MRKAVTKTEELEKRMAVQRDEFTKKITHLTLESDRLKRENSFLRKKLAERDGRLAFYENPHAPSSTNSMYNAERDAARKDGVVPKATKEKRPPGPPKGHAGASHKNKATKTITLSVSVCGKCGSKSIRQLSPTVKLVNDFVDGRMEIECIAYVRERIICQQCNSITCARHEWVEGTSFGPRALGFIYEYYNKRNTDESIAHFFNSLYDFKVSPNAVWNARRAIAKLLEGEYRSIMVQLKKAPFIQFDESPISIDGKKGYAWLVTAGKLTYIVVSPSRAAAVLELHFSGLLDKPLVSDGYAAYNIFPVRQRCWVHLLREAEKHAIKNGGNDLIQYKRLLELYRSIRHRDAAEPEECEDLKRAVLEIASSYGSDSPLRTKLEGAAPYLFTFLQHPGMPPHNNQAELEIRDAVVLQRNVRHKLCTPEGMRIFSVLSSVARTSNKMAIFARQVVENLVKDPEWSMFEPPPKEVQAECITTMAS